MCPCVRLLLFITQDVGVHPFILAAHTLVPQMGAKLMEQKQTPAYPPPSSSPNVCRMFSLAGSLQEMRHGMTPR